LSAALLVAPLSLVAKAVTLRTMALRASGATLVPALTTGPPTSTAALAMRGSRIGIGTQFVGLASSVATVSAPGIRVRFKFVPGTPKPSNTERPTKLAAGSSISRNLSRTPTATPGTSANVARLSLSGRSPVPPGGTFRGLSRPAAASSSARTKEPRWSSLKVWVRSAPVGCSAISRGLGAGPSVGGWSPNISRSSGVGVAGGVGRRRGSTVGAPRLNNPPAASWVRLSSVLSAALRSPSTTDGPRTSTTSARVRWKRSLRARAPGESHRPDSMGMG
jgi:hypothetical protein